MSNNEKNRKFNFSYGELLQQALEKSTFFRRDEGQLALRGVTTNRLDAFDDMITAFRATKEDIVFLGLIKDASQKRDEKRKQLEIAGRDLLGIAELTFRNNQGIYDLFGFVNLSKLNDGELGIACDTLYDNINQYSSDLTAKGLTTAMITEFRTLIDEFDPMIKYLAAAKSDRDKNTRKRTAAANTLYNELVEICLAGVNYFKDRDQGKYSDYVIYSQSATAQTRSGSLEPNTIVSRSFTGIHPETAFKIKNEGTGPLDFYYSTTEGGKPLTLFVSVVEYQEHSYTATELGYSVETGAVKFNIRNTSETETRIYLIRIE